MPDAEIKKLHYRKAEMEEMEWTYQLFKAGLQRYIADTWGWNELFQQHSFLVNLPASSFVIVSLENGGNQKAWPEDIGAYCLKNKSDHLYLEMLLITPAQQRQGLGSQIMQHIMLQAEQQGLPLRLSVLKNNPAHLFYRQLGFRIDTEDNFRFRMSLPDSGSNELPAP